VGWPLLLLALCGFDPRPLAPRWESRIPGLLDSGEGAATRDPDLDRMAAALTDLDDPRRAHRVLRGLGAWEGLLVPLWASPPSDPVVQQQLEATLGGQVRALGVTHFGLHAGADSLVVLAVRRQLASVDLRPLGQGRFRVLATPAGKLRDPRGWVGLPDGTVHEVPVEDRGGLWHLEPKLGPAPGWYEVEITARGAHGTEVALMLARPVGVSGPPGEPLGIPRSEATEDPVEAHLAWVNRVRRQRGLAPLARDPDLDATARTHAEAMARTGLLAHELADRRGPLTRLRAAGIRSQRAHENIALGSSFQAAEDRLWESPSHRAAMLDPGVRRLGVGHREAAEGAVFLVQHLVR
jgi:uncharacterized protein YkwD